MKLILSILLLAAYLYAQFVVGGQGGGGGGGGIQYASELQDCRVTAAGNTATITAPCRFSINSVVQTLATSATASLSGTSSNGTVYFYWTSGGVLTADENTAATLTCVGCTSASTGGFPADSYRIASADFTANSYTSVTDFRTFMHRNSVECGTGASCSYDGTTGKLTITPDPPVTPSIRGSFSALPTCTLAIAGQVYIESVSGLVGHCNGTSWFWYYRGVPALLPVSTDWTYAGTGSTTISYANGVALITAASSANRVDLQTLPGGGSWTITLGINNNVTNGCGIVLTNGTNYATMNVIMMLVYRSGSTDNPTLGIFEYTGNFTYNNQHNGITPITVMHHPQHYLRISLSSGTRTFRYSQDGLAWYTAGTSPVGHYFTATHWGWACGGVTEAVIWHSEEL